MAIGYVGQIGSAGGGGGGTIADGSITTNKLAANAVTAGKVDVTTVPVLAADNVFTGSITANDGVSTSTLHASNGLQMVGSASGNTFSIIPDENTDEYAWTAPATPGAAGQLLATDGTGVLSWVNSLGSTLVAKSASFTVTAADSNKLFQVATGDDRLVATLPNTATLTAGWECKFRIISSSASRGISLILSDNVTELHRLTEVGGIVTVYYDGATLQSEVAFGTSATGTLNLNGRSIIYLGLNTQYKEQCGFWLSRDNYNTPSFGVGGGLGWEFGWSGGIYPQSNYNFGGPERGLFKNMGVSETFYFANSSTPATPSGGARIYSASGVLRTINSSGDDGAIVTNVNGLVDIRLPSDPSRYTKIGFASGFISTIEAQSHMIISSGGNITLASSGLLSGSSWATDTNTKFNICSSSILYGSVVARGVYGNAGLPNANAFWGTSDGYTADTRQNAGNIVLQAGAGAASNGTYAAGTGGSITFDLGSGGAGSGAVPAGANGVCSIVGGNVGVGTTTPATTLDVNGIITQRSQSLNSRMGPVFDRVGNEIFSIIDGTTPMIVFAGQFYGGVRFSSFANSADYDFNAGQLHISGSTGSVGIGTTTPAEKLDVNGNIRLSGLLTLDNISAPSTPSGGALLYASAGVMRTINSAGVDGAIVDTASTQTITGAKAFGAEVKVTTLALSFADEVPPSTAVGLCNGNGQVIFYGSGGTRVASIGSYGDFSALLVRPGALIGFGSNTAIGGGNFLSNAALASPSAGVVEINNGTAGGIGSLQLNAGGLLKIKSGTNQRAGNATLVGGTITVANTTVTANTIVMLTRKTSGGTIGTAITYSVIAATSFTITSDNILDTSTFSYFLIEVN